MALSLNPASGSPLSLVSAAGALVNTTNKPSEVGDVPTWDGSGWDFLHSVFDIRSYDALESNTENNDEIQAALTAAREAGGGIVLIPEGTWKVTSDLVIGSNTVLRGAGPGSILKRTSTTSTVAVLKNYDRTFGGTDTDIMVENLTVWRDGEATTANTPYDNTIYMKGVTRVAVRNCRVRGGAAALHLEACSNYEVSGCVFDSYVDKAIGNSWDSSATTVANGRIINNFFDTPTASGFTLGSSTIICTVSGLLIEGNVFKDCASNAIELGGASTHTVSHVRISGNLMKHSGKANVNNSILGLTCEDITVDGNTVEKGSITFDVNDETAEINERIRVSNNTVTAGKLSVRLTEAGSVQGNSVQGAASTPSLSVQSSQDVLVSGNTVLEGAGIGIHCSTASGSPPYANRRIRIIGNLIVDCTTGASQAGIVIDGGDKIEVVRNRCYDTGAAVQTHGFYVNATTNYVDSDNNFSGNVTAARRAATGSPTIALAGYTDGAEISYAESTSSFTASNTTEGTATTHTTSAAIVCDGVSAIEIEYGTPRVDITAQTATAYLFDAVDGGAAASLGILGTIGTDTASSGSKWSPRFTRRVVPAAGSHVFTVRWASSSGTAVVRAGAGGSGTLLPAYIKVRKAV